ncbi:hypothetical protein MHYP_G00274000 [Metynnis hypsauchen]
METGLRMEKFEALGASGGRTFAVLTRFLSTTRSSLRLLSHFDGGARPGLESRIKTPSSWDVFGYLPTSSYTVLWVRSIMVPYMTYIRAMTGFKSCRKAPVVEGPSSQHALSGVFGLLWNGDGQLRTKAQI